VYRFLDDKRPAAQHYLTVRELEPHRSFKKDLEKECRACSLSVFTDKEEVVRIQRLVPRWRVPVAEGKLDSTSGVVKHTPSLGTNNSHHSWWIPVTVKAWNLFYATIDPPENT
jgi:hypothetical protein